MVVGSALCQPPDTTRALRPPAARACGLEAGPERRRDPRPPAARLPRRTGKAPHDRHGMVGRRICSGAIEYGSPPAWFRSSFELRHGSAGHGVRSRDLKCSGRRGVRRASSRARRVPVRTAISGESRGLTMNARATIAASPKLVADLVELITETQQWSRRHRAGGPSPTDGSRTAPRREAL